MMRRPDNRFQLGQARHFYHLLLNGQQPVNAGAMAGIVEEMERMDAEIARLRRAIAPLLSHAEAHDYAPPIRLSVSDCRDIKEKVDG